MSLEFFPHPSYEPDERLRHIETFLSIFSGRLASDMTSNQAALDTLPGGVATGLPAPSGGGGGGAAFLNGDVTGPVANTVVASLQSYTLTLTSPVTGEVLTYNGTAVVNSSILNGHIAINQAGAPTAGLHLGAGTAAAGTAPAKLTTGPLLTITEAGAIEFVAPSLFFSPVTTRRTVSLASHSIVADVTVANTVTETLLYTGVIAANELAAGKTARICLAGQYSGLVADNFTLRFKVGGVTYLTVASTAAAVATQLWQAEFRLTCRTTGAGGTAISSVLAVANNVIASAADVGTHAVDTTAAQNTTVTIQWSAAFPGDTLTLTQGILEVLG